MDKPADVLNIGQEIEAKIVDFNEEEKKISLSLKAMLAPTEEPAETYDQEQDEDADESAEVEE